MTYYAEALHQQILKLGQRWVEAELHGDSSALADLLAVDFVFVTQNGALIDRNRYLYARQAGDLKHVSFTWGEARARIYDGAAIVVGILTQRSSFRGKDASGVFRATQICVQRSGRWTLAGLHLCRLTATS